MITIETLKNTLKKLNYKWFEDRVNLIAIRTTLSVPDVFNDVLCVYAGGELSFYTITTEPGVAYQKNLLNSKGCALLKPGQYLESYSLGYHQNKPDHRALVQTGKVTVYRDADRDGVIEETTVTDTGHFGINIHGANKGIKTEKIGPWSAGCQVFQNWKDKEDVMDICEKYKKACGNKFTFTLIKETDLV